MMSDDDRDRMCGWGWATMKSRNEYFIRKSVSPSKAGLKEKVIIQEMLGRDHATS